MKVKGAKVEDFAKLCGDVAEMEDLGGCVAVIGPPNDRHAVAAQRVLQRPGGQVVVAKNSWGSKSPRMDVTPENYDSHYRFDVEIVKCEQPLFPPISATDSSATLQSCVAV